MRAGSKPLPANGRADGIGAWADAGAETTSRKTTVRVLECPIQPAARPIPSAARPPSSAAATAVTRDARIRAHCSVVSGPVYLRRLLARAHELTGLRFHMESPTHPPKN